MTSGAPRLFTHSEAGAARLERSRLVRSAPDLVSPQPVVGEVRSSGPGPGQAGTAGVGGCGQGLCRVVSFYELPRESAWRAGGYWSGMGRLRRGRVQTPVRAGDPGGAAAAGLMLTRVSPLTPTPQLFLWLPVAAQPAGACGAGGGGGVRRRGSGLWALD